MMKTKLGSCCKCLRSAVCAAMSEEFQGNSVEVHHWLCTDSNSVVREIPFMLTDKHQEFYPKPEKSQMQCRKGGKCI